MRYAAVTATLMVAALVGAAWIGLRDYDTGALAERDVARGVAFRLLAPREPGLPACPTCRAEIVRRAGGHRWVARIVDGPRARCVRIDLRIELRQVPEPHGELARAAPASCPGLTGRAPARGAPRTAPAP